MLAAQFESFRDPFIVMLTVPLAVAGAVLSLWYFRQTLNIFSQIGIIMLIGLVTKNGILIVEFANQRKRTGLSRLDAVQSSRGGPLPPHPHDQPGHHAGRPAHRPGPGSASGSRSSMGIAVIGGLLFSGFLSLYVVPAVYSYLSRPVRAQDAEEAALLGAPAH